MHMVKASWSGRTFALATTSDSGGRKTRIRRSKEERKAMIESFIQRYQGSNDGNFPSLNLTHKEVGGSFYTVREIVREIIQENRVLGPARYNPEVDHDDAAKTVYPLGSIALEPLSLERHETGDLNVISKNLERESMELPLHDNAHYFSHQELELSKSASEHSTDEIVKYSNVLISSHAEHEGSKLSSNSIAQHLNEDLNEDEIDTRGFMNGIITNEISCETGKREATKKLSQETGKHETARLAVPKILAAGKELAVVGASVDKPRHPIEEIVVETFPLRPANKEADDSARLSTQSGSLSGSLSDSKTRQTELTSGTSDTVQSSSFVVSYGPLITEEANSFENSISLHGSNGGSELYVNGEVSQCIEGVIIDAADTAESPVIKEDTLVSNCYTYQLPSQGGVVSKTSEQLDDQCYFSYGALEPNNSPTEAMSFETRNETSRKSNDREPQFAALNRIDIHRDNKAVSASSPVDRINLQSWEKGVLKQRPNPLLAVVKAFVDAFVKFWS